jgi:serine/threonine protein kinase
MTALEDLVKGKAFPPQSSDSAQLILVLDIFHRTGWVHRDISAGNVFLLQDELLFKLGDLEFAKKMGKDGEHDVRTVSIPFQAICTTLMLDKGHARLHVY